MHNFTKWLLLLALSLSPMLAMSQVMVEQYAMETGVDASKWITLPADTSITKTALSNGGDGRASSVLDMGFDFIFGGEIYSQFSVNTDGNFRFGPEVTGTLGYSTPFGENHISNNLPKINFFGDDADMIGNGYVKYALIGTTPSRTLVVEFNTRGYYAMNNNSDVKWQIQLSESSNEIQIVYDSVAPLDPPRDFQLGMASSENDVITINPSTNMVITGVTEQSFSIWPLPSTYYRFYEPTCVKPSGLNVDGLTTTTANISWNANANQTNWEYVCVENGADPNWENAVSVNSTSTTITDLLPNTRYAVYVRTNCGAGDVSNAISKAFRTECVSAEAPYVEGFEEYDGNTFPPCWKSKNGTSGVREDGMYYANSHSGTKCLEIAPLDVVLAPKVKLAANEMMAIVYVKNSGSADGDLEIGYVTNTATMDFVPMQSVLMMHSSYQEFIVDYSSLDITDTINVAFRYNHDTYTSYYIDDVTIMRATTCPRPSFALVRDITHNSAIVEWEANDEVLSHEVAYGLSDTLENANIVSVEVGTNVLQLTDLIENTTYHVWVRNVCDVDSSIWCSVGSFNTKPSCAQVIDAQIGSISYNTASVSWDLDESYGEDITAVEVMYKKSSDESWSLPISVTDQNYYILQGLDDGTSYQVRLQTNCGETTAANVDLEFFTKFCAFEVSDDEEAMNNNFPFGGLYSYAYNQMLYPAAELVGLDTIKGIAFNVSTIQSINRNVDVYVANVSQATLTPETKIPYSAFTKVVQNLSVPIHQGWIAIAFDSIFVYDGSSNLVIAVDDNTGSYDNNISVKVHNSGTTIYKRVDYLNINPMDSIIYSMNSFAGTPDIQFISSCASDVECLAPTVAFGDINSNSVAIHWIAGTTETQWEVGCKLSDADDWTSEVVNTTDYVFSNLLPGSLYDIRVGALCGGDTLYTTMQVFTDCVSVGVPFEENFDDEDLPCWAMGALPENNGRWDIDWIPEVQLIEMGYTGGYLITPQFSENLNTLQVSFSAGAVDDWTNGVVVISAGNDPNDYNTFVPIDTVMIYEGMAMSPQIVSLANYSGSGHYVMFSSFSGGARLDNIKIEEIPECSMPSDLVISDITSDGAILNWTDAGLTVEKWIVSYVKYGETSFSTIEVNFDEGPSCDLTGLSANTEYTVYVTTVCTSGDSNRTLYPVTFRTECADMVLPYTEGFEGISNGDFHLCWYRDPTNTISGDEIQYWYVAVPSVYVGESTSNTVILASNKKIISPKVPLAANKISINFDMRVQDTAYTGDLVVGFSTHADSDADMIVLDTIEAEDADWHNYTVDFNTLTNTNTGYVVFKNVNNDSLWYDFGYHYFAMWLDNVNFSEYSTCARPTNVSVANITATTMNVSFEDAVNTGNYTIAWNTEDDVTSANTVNVTNTTATLNNLLPGTFYYVWVRSDCSATEHSAWVIGGKYKTECLPMDLPYSENFDNYTFGVGMGDNVPTEYPNNVMPDCWSVKGLNPAGNPFAMISNYPHYAVSGTNVLFAQSGPDNYLYMIMPKFNVPLDSLMLNFTYKNSSISGRLNEFVLGVLTDPTDTSTFILLTDLPTTNVATEIEHVFAMDEAIVAGTNYNIAFRFGGNDSYGEDLAIDDVSVVYAPSCYRPTNLHITNVSSTTANIGWNGNAANYQVHYRVVNDDAWIENTTNTNSIVLSGLTANNNYEMQVRGICGVGDTSAWSNVFNFNTLCVATPLPWSENFNSYTTDVSSNAGRPITYPNHAMPECWIFSEMTASDYGGPAVWLSSCPNSSWNHHNVIDGVSLHLVSDESRATYAILPQFDADIDTIALYFKYCMASYGQPLELGVVTNPYDFSTYIQLATYPVHDSAYSAEHYFANDDLDPNETYYIVFKTGFSYSDATIIDDIVVDYIPSCIRPAEPVVSAIMSNTAKISWNTDAGSSEVAYQAENTETWNNVVVNTDSIILTGLIGNTHYEVKVRAICGDGDTSAWSESAWFVTECDPYALPFSEDFSVINDITELDCWALYTGLVDQVMAGTAELEEDEGFGKWTFENDLEEPLASPHIRLNIYGENCARWIVTPQLAITPNSTLSFDVAFSDYSDPIEAIYDEDDRFYVLATTDNGEHWTKLMTWGSDENDTYTMDSLTLEGDSVAIGLDQFSGQNIRIAFYGESTVSGGDNNLHIDNVFVDGIPCMIPTNVNATPTAISAEITWSGNSASYEIALRENGSTVWPEAIVTTDTSYTFTDLTPDVMYEYRVRQVCTDELYSDWVTGVFATLALPCGKPVVTVADITGDGATITWTEGENNESWEVNVYNAMINESYDVTEASYMITNLEHATEYNVAVRAKCAANIYSDWSDTISFSTLDCFPVTNVVASDITENSAVITWTAGGDESQWEINYGEMDFGQGDGILEIVNATSYTITGLEPETDYDVYVRAICGEDFNSTWSEPVCQFQTSVGAPEGIDGIDGNFQFAIYPNPTSGMTTISLNGIEGKVTISVVDMNGRTITNESMECGSECEKRLDVAGLSQGTYFVRVLGDNINSVRKLIVR